MKNFWLELKKPIMALAPMEGVTDSAFRQIIAQYGRPDVMFTWFISVEGLMSIGRNHLLKDLYYEESERPIVAQIFGITPDKYYESAKLLKNLGFDGIDINMGCPDKRIIKQGACSALIDRPDLAKKIILATKEGAQGLPISIKTRLGTKKNTSRSWLKLLAETHPSAITLHGRLSKDMSKYPADWDEIAAAGQIVKAIDPDIIFLGNGDVQSLSAGQQKSKQYNLDGVMFGRAIFGNPWLFNPNINKADLSLSQVLNVLRDHIMLFNKLHQHRNFALMKKHFASYISGFPNIKPLKIKLMEAKNASAAVSVIEDYL